MVNLQNPQSVYLRSEDLSTTDAKAVAIVVLFYAMFLSLHATVSYYPSREGKRGGRYEHCGYPINSADQNA